MGSTFNLIIDGSPPGAGSTFNLKMDWVLKVVVFALKSGCIKATGFNMYNDVQISKTFTEGLIKAGIERKEM